MPEGVDSGNQVPLVIGQNGIASRPVANAVR